MADLLRPDQLVPRVRSERRLTEVGYLAFPLRTDAGRPAVADRGRHVRDQIEQVLFTAPGERPHRPDWGIGVEHLVFEPGAEALRAVVHQRLTSTLAEVLAGEVEPSSLAVEVTVRDDTTLVVRIGYALATVGRQVEHLFERRAAGGATT